MSFIVSRENIKSQENFLKGPRNTDPSLQGFTGCPIASFVMLLDLQFKYSWSYTGNDHLLP